MQIRAQYDKAHFEDIGFYSAYPDCFGAAWKNSREKCKIQANAENHEKAGKENMKSIYLAGGCFWGTQKFFDQFDGVLKTEVGYANGPTENPSYQDVCAKSGHAETVKIVYDPEIITLPQLIEYYFMTIDPLAYHRQGADRGIQYRTGIYYTDEEDLSVLEDCYAREQEKYKQKMEVELMPLENFYPAEEYHQKYLEKNPGGYCHIPKALLDLQKSEEQKAQTSVIL